MLLDNGRSAMLGTEYQEMLRCIRCGACMNHCPVYQAVGGHAYGWVYPGPMGAVLTPTLIGVDKAGHLPNASTFCGRCESVCPMRIPLPKLMRHWREREFERHLTPATQRGNLALWAWFARRPGLSVGGEGDRQSQVEHGDGCRRQPARRHGAPQQGQQGRGRRPQHSKRRFRFGPVRLQTARACLPEKRSDCGAWVAASRPMNSHGD